MFAREKETVSDKPRKNMLHDKTIPPYLKVVKEVQKDKKIRN